MGTKFSPNDSSHVVVVTYTRSCAVIGCRKEADLVRIGSTIWQLKIDVFLCQKHMSGSL